MPTTNKAKIPVGFVIGGKYRVTGELGRGGMAAVYEAENVDIGKRVAIKVLAQELISSAVVVERFLREARAVAAIRSPYICDVYDSGRLDDGRPFLVLELLEGESLYEQMIRVGQIDVPTTVTIINQTCKGLVKAHAIGIVHRDLKPENIFVTKDEEGRILAKILDFGLAKFYSSMETGNAGQARLTREGAVFGTPAYMSPEQVRGQGAVDSRADLWALGCIAYESLTGRTVWSTEQGVAMTFAQIANAPLPDPIALRADLPESFRTWFERALDRNIEKRFQTPKEFAETLLKAMQMGQVSQVSIGDEESFSIARPLVPGGSIRDGEPSIPNSIPISKPLPDSARSSRGHFAAPGTAAGGAPFSSKADLTSQTDNQPATQADPRTRGSGGRVAVGIAAVLLLGGAGYAGYRALVPPAEPATSMSATPSGSALPSSSSGPLSASAISSDGPPPVDGLPIRPLISQAQEMIAAGDLEGGQKKLKEALALGGHGFPRAMLEHLDQALAGKKENAACLLTGLGRPRSYDLLDDKTRVVAAGRPSIALGPHGPVVTWTENHEGTEQAFAVGLDNALRARTAALPVTPEGQAIGMPQIYAAGDLLALTYWEARGPDTGVYARFLDGDGHVASSRTKVAQASGGAYWPTFSLIPDSATGAPAGGAFEMGWIAPSDRNTDDLFMRTLSPDTKDCIKTDSCFKPSGPVVRATAIQPGPGSHAKVRFAVSATDGQAIHLAFRLERDPNHTIQHVRIPFADLGSSLPMKDIPNNAPDKTMGEMNLVNTDKGRGDQPAIACTPSSCFVTWNDEAKEGAWAAYFDGGKSTSLWQNKIAPHGKRPVVATNATKAQAFWFEGGKVMTGALDRDGVHGASRIARVSGDQPMASVVAGKKPGEWYISWLDYEAGHLEVYAARTECK